MLTSAVLSHRSFDHRRAKPLLGTLVEVSLTMGDIPSSRDEFNHACDAAFEAVSHVHKCMSLHLPDSDLSKLARAGAGQVVTLQACTAEVLRLASWLEEVSSGVFNAAACAPALAERGLLPVASHGPVFGNGSLLNDLEWLPPQDAGKQGEITVRVLNPICVDLGGIAKGWAVDAAVQTLQSAGVLGGMVNAGGDLRVFGPHSQSISVRHPGQVDKLIPLVSLSDGSMATTAFQRDEWPIAGRSVWPRAVVVSNINAHMADGPFWPSVSVLAPNCAMADALTKVLMIKGPEAAAVLRQCGADGVGIDFEGRVHHV